MNLKNLLMISYLIISFFYLANFDASLWVWLSFFLNFLIITFITYYHLYLEKVFSPFLSTFIVFNYIFFFAAPISQINDMLIMEKPVFLNNFLLKEPLIIQTSLLISLFNIIFFLSYDYLKKSKLNSILKEAIPVKYNNLPLAILLMLILSAIIVFSNLDFIIYEYNRPEWMESTFTKSIALIKSKVLFIFPLGAIIACKAYFDSKNKNVNNAYIIGACFLLLIMFLLVVKNPLITKRHDLGPILFIALFMFLPKVVNSNAKFLNILFFAIIVGLPLSQLITHSDYGIEEIISKPSRLLDQVNQGLLTDGYISLNYDAFMNIGTVIEVVQQDGYSYGYQMLSALLFFVPRSLWMDKPESSGMVVGEHLTAQYDFYFQNVSNPFLSEAYHNFGVFGVVIFSIFLAISCVFMLKWLYSDSWFKKAMSFYFSLHLIMILRGDFTSSFAYLIATFLGIYVLPKIIINLFNYKIIFKKKIRNGPL